MNIKTIKMKKLSTEVLLEKLLFSGTNKESEVKSELKNRGIL